MSAKLESPKIEMKRLLRVIAGKALAGEKDDQLRMRAARRLNADLPCDRLISDRRSRSYWHAESEDIPSDHMDRARELAFIQPIQEAEDAIVKAEEFLAGLRARLVAAAGSPTRRVGTGRSLGGSDAGARREGGGPQNSPHGAAVAR